MGFIYECLFIELLYFTDRTFLLSRRSLLLCLGLKFGPAGLFPPEPIKRC